MPADSITEITGLEPTYSAREAATVLKRSYSWLDQRLRHREFAQPDGAVVQPFRSPGGYRYFTIEMLRDIAACCYRHRWFSFEELKAILRELAIVEHRGAADPGIPSEEVSRSIGVSLTRLVECGVVSIAPTTV